MDNFNVAIEQQQVFSIAILPRESMYMNTHITITLGKGSHMACKCKNVCKACGLEHRLNSDNPFYFTNQLYIPATAMLAEAEDGLLLATVQV